MAYDIQWLRSATKDQLVATLKLGPEVIAEVNATLATPEGRQISKEMINDPDYIPVSQRQPDPDEAAQIAEDEARAVAQAEADAAALAAEEAARAAAANTPTGPTQQELDAAEDAEAKVSGITVTRENGRITRLVQAYQVTDESGRPIGRPTHLEARSWAELATKQKLAHENGVRYAERIKKNRVQNIETISKNNTDFQQAQKAREEADVAIQEAAKDTTKLPEAIRKSTAAERAAADATRKAFEEGQRIALSWMEDHKDDYVMCQANSDKLGAWLTKNNMPLTYETLELAYLACESELAKPVVEPTTQPAPAVVNPPAAAPAVAATAQPLIPAAPAAPPQVPALPSAPPPTQESLTPPSTPAAAPNVQPAARRPGVNGGVMPGSATPRPAAQQTSVASTRSEIMKEIKKMSTEQYRIAMKNPKFRARCEAAGIPFANSQS